MGLSALLAAGVPFSAATYDLFWSFRSPYSYLVTPRLLELERDFDVRANVRPVYPIAVRIEGFFKSVNPQWWSYLRRDVARTAEMLGLPYAPPNPDPIMMDLNSGEVAKEQRYIGRLKWVWEGKGWSYKGSRCCIFGNRSSRAFLFASMAQSSSVR